MLKTVIQRPRGEGFVSGGSEAGWSPPVLSAAALRVLSPVLDSLRDLGAEANALFAKGEQPTPEDLPLLRPAIHATLESLDGLASGCGFLAAPNAFRGGRLCQQWWSWAEGEAVELTLDFDSGSESFYDYSVKEYFARPAVTGLPEIEGPYVDYLCTQEYILTCAVPVLVRDRFVGVVGADISIGSFQRRLLDEDFGGVDIAAALVNNKGRVIFSTVSRLEPGSMVRNAELTEWFTAKDRAAVRTTDFKVWPCEPLPWAVIAFNHDD